MGTWCCQFCYWYWLTVALGTGLGAGCFQTSWSPKFTKDNTKRLTLVTRIAWARH
jgi:hypothetical protein